VTQPMHSVNPFMGTLKQQSNEPLNSNKVIGTLAVDGWAVMMWYSEEGRPVPSSSLYQM